MRTWMLFMVLLGAAVGALGQADSVRKTPFIALHGHQWPSDRFLWYFDPAIPVELETGLSAKANLASYQMLQMWSSDGTYGQIHAGVQKYFRINKLRKGISYCGPVAGIHAVFASQRHGYFPGSPYGPWTREYEFGVGARVGFRLQLKNRILLGALVHVSRVHWTRHFPVYFNSTSRLWYSDFVPRCSLGYLISGSSKRVKPST